MTGKGKRQSRASETARLRPATFDDVIGQKEAVDELRLACAAALGRREMPGHILLTGEAGTGKTTLALCVAQAMGRRMVPLFGVNLRRLSDVTRPLLTAQAGDVIFIDEIHRMYRPVQETLFTVMEDGKLNLGADGSNRVIPLKPLCIVGATTDPGRLLTPMLDRFSLIVRLRLYRPDELVGIAHHAAQVLGVALNEDAALRVAEAAAGVPRVCIRLVRAARDHAAQGGIITVAAVDAVLSSTALVWREEGRSASSR